MRRAIVCLLLLGCVVGAAAALPAAVAAAQGATPASLLPEGALRATFEAATGATADPTWFGVYAIEPVGENLYVGLGTGRPAEYDGALLARLDGAGLTPLASLPEQGFIGMVAVGGRLYIPGADPEEDWSLGNVYVHDLATGQTTQRRTLPGVIHTLSVLREADGRLLATVGRYLPEQVAWPWAGGIYASVDDGLTWTLDADPALGANRTFDVRRWRGGLVAVADDAALEGCQLATQAPGMAWQRGAAWVLCKQRLAVLGDGRRVVAAGADGRSLVEAGAVRGLPLPFAVERNAWNWQAFAGRTLFVLADDGRVMATEDLRTWRGVAEFDLPLVSVAFWPERGGLVVAERGATGQLWLVPLW